MRTVLGQPKRLALLSYLAAATPRAFHSRDTLLALLWPDLDQEHARAALRQALYVLRRELGDVVVTCGDEVIGVNDRRLWCDVIAFDHAIDAGDRARALALYRGELLAGFHVARALEFERWLEGARARLAARAAAAAWGLVDHEQRRGDLASAAEWARRLLSVSPDDERALRRVLALLHMLGDRAAALRAYRDFARRIAADYEIKPAAETDALISAIRSADPSSLVRNGQVLEDAIADRAVGHSSPPP